MKTKTVENNLGAIFGISEKRQEELEIAHTNLAIQLHEEARLNGSKQFDLVRFITESLKLGKTPKEKQMIALGAGTVIGRTIEMDAKMREEAPQIFLPTMMGD